MWTLTNVSYSNFRLLRRVDLELERKGLVIVLGENKDIPGCSSNQGGKSTLLHGITWAMYECDTLGDRITDSALRTSTSFCKVAVTLREDKGTIALIQRTRRKKPRVGKPTVSLEVWIGDQHWKGIPDEVQKHIDATFGQKEIFLASHIFGYEETYIPFARLPDREKKSLFDLLISSEDLDIAQQKARERGKCLETTRRKLHLCRAALAGKLKALCPLQEEHRLELNIEKERLSSQLTTLQEATRKTRKVYQGACVAKEKVTLAYAEAGQKLDSMLDTLKMSEQLQAKIVHTQQELDTISTKTCPKCEAPLSDKRSKSLMRQPLMDLSTTRQRLKDLSPVSDEDITHQEHRVTALRGRVDIATKKERDLSTKLTGSQATLIMLSKQLDTLDKSIQNAQITSCTRLQALRTAQDTLEYLHNELGQQRDAVAFWEQGFGPSGLRSFRLDLLTPRLNQIAEWYSQELFGDGSRVRYSTQTKLKSGEYRDKFALCIEDKQGREIEACSAGQCMRRDLIHLFSIVKLAGEMEKRTVRLLAFDESFRTLDKAGVAETMRILRTFLEDASTILVIEHSDDMRAEFDKALIVSRQRNRATVAYSA